MAVLKAEDLPEVTAMLGRCSRATLYKRFHGFTDGVAHASFTIDDPAQDAYGAWSGGTCVGMASLAITQEGHGEIGVLVEDAWQRRGAGASARRCIGRAGATTWIARAHCRRAGRQLLRPPVTGPCWRHQYYVRLFGLSGARWARGARYCRRRSR